MPSKKTKLIVGITVGLALAAAASTAGVLLSRRPDSCESAHLPCGTTAADDPNCAGTVCEDPDAVCTDLGCVIDHACDETGACVPTPGGPYRGATCSCVGLMNDACTVVGDGGAYKSVTACAARAADYQCVPGTGTCERVLGATTGWRTPSQCRCFECTPGMECVPSLEAHPEDGVDGAGCAECGRYGCADGTCVRKRVGGSWDDPDDCACGLCEGGECVATDGGGMYKTVAACEADGASMCQNSSLGWACASDAGNAQTCKQVVGGTASSLDDCRCWSCDGAPPGPASECVLDSTNSGQYSTFDECLMDESAKCGWKYGCAA